MIINAPFLIGVDPGNNTGVCLYRRSDNQFEIHTVPPWNFIDLVSPWIDDKGSESFHCIMEDPRQNPPVFNRNVKRAVLHKIAQNVGSNKRDTDWLEYYINELSVSLTLIKPTDSKWTSKTLKAITGYSKQTNEHTRDAIRLVYGR